MYWTPLLRALKKSCVQLLAPKTIKLAYQAVRELEMNTGSRSQASVRKQVSEVLDLVEEFKVSKNKQKRVFRILKGEEMKCSDVVWPT